MTFADLVGPDLIPTTIGGGIRGTKTVIVEIERLDDIERIKDEIDPIFQGPVMFFADYMAFTGLVAPYLVVTIDPNYGPYEIFSDYGITEFQQITPFRYIVAPKVKNAFEIFSILERFLSDPRIIHADPDTIALMGLLQARREPNDQHYGDQWYLRTVLAPEGWIFVYGGRIDGVQVFPVVSTQMIAIVDTGVDPNHEDLRDILYYGSTGDNTICIDPRTSERDPHGTNVAGIAGAYTNNSIGIAGMIWSSPGGDRIIPYDLCDGVTRATVGEFLEDIIDAAGVEGAVAVNASWVFAEGSFTTQQLAILAWPLYCARSEALTVFCDVLTYVASTGECQVLDITLPGGLPPRGTSLVFAAGNGSACCRLLPSVTSPTNDPNDYRCPVAINFQTNQYEWIVCPQDCQFVVFQGNEPDQCRTMGLPAACYCPFSDLYRFGATEIRLTEPQRFARQPCFEGRMITVGATDQNDNRADFSTVAPHVTVLAPGVNIFTTTIGGYGSVSSTSFSAPLVTGLVGLLSKLNPLLSVQEIFDIVTSTARDRGDQGRDNIFGYGRIDVRRAIMKTLFYGEPLYLEDQELSGPFTISFTNSTVGTVKSTQLVFWNLRQGRGVMYALVVLEPLSTDNVRVVSFTINGTPVEGNRAVVILSPGRSATVRLDFELIKDASFDETFMLKVYTNYGIRPSDLQEFGGTLPFPITTPADFQDKGDLEGRAIRVTRTVCGDGVCGGDENCVNCVQDCGSCPPPPGGGSECASFCKLPLCIPIFCLPKAGCIYICFPPPGWATCPLCCLWCLFVFGDPGPGIPEEIPPELADIMQSPECNLCSESLKSEGGSAFGKSECKLCIEKVVQRGASLSYQCDMCLMNIRDYGEQGADSSWCAICKDQWEAMYEAYKDAVQSTMP
jgi:subtilisin family serine protease